MNSALSGEGVTTPPSDDLSPESEDTPTAEFEVTACCGGPIVDGVAVHYTRCASARRGQPSERRQDLLELLRVGGAAPTHVLATMLQLRGWPRAYLETVDSDLRVLERSGDVRPIDKPRVRGRRWMAVDRDCGCYTWQECERLGHVTTPRAGGEG